MLDTVPNKAGTEEITSLFQQWPINNGNHTHKKADKLVTQKVLLN